MIDLVKNRMMIGFFVFMVGITIFDSVHVNKKNNIRDENNTYIAINQK